MRAWAALLAKKSHYISEYEAELKTLADTAAFNKQTALLTAECAEAAALVDDCIAVNAASALNQTEYQKRYDELVAQYDKAKSRLNSIKQEKLEQLTRREKIRRFLEILRKTETVPDNFDEKLWRKTVESMTIYSLEKVTVRFTSGTEIYVSVE